VRLHKRRRQVAPLTKKAFEEFMFFLYLISYVRQVDMYVYERMIRVKSKEIIIIIKVLKFMNERKEWKEKSI